METGKTTISCLFLMNGLVKWVSTVFLCKCNYVHFSHIGMFTGL